MRGVERAVTQAVIRALKAMMPRRPVASMAVLSAASTASKPELQKMVLPRMASAAPAFESDAAQFAGQLRLQGVRMDVAHGVQQLSHLPLPGATTRGLAWPAAATPKAAVKSRYFRPSASQTCAPWRAPRRSARSRPARCKACCAIRKRAAGRGLVLVRCSLGTVQTPLWSGGQMTLCICSWKRTGSASAMILSTSSRREMGVWPGGNLFAAICPAAPAGAAQPRKTAAGKSPPTCCVKTISFAHS